MGASWREFLTGSGSILLFAAVTLPVQANKLGHERSCRKIEKGFVSVMISHRTAGLHNLFVLIQVLLAAGLFAGWISLFAALRGPVANPERYLVYGGVVVVALLFESLKRNREDVRVCLFEQSLTRLHAIAFRQVLWVAGALVLFVTLLKDAALSRVFLVTYSAALYLVLLVLNRWLPCRLAEWLFRGRREQRTLLVGPSQKVPLVKAWLERRSPFGFKTIGLLSNEKNSGTIEGYDVIGTPEEIDGVISNFKVSQVIFLGLPTVSHVYHHLSQVCNRHGVRMTILSDLEDKLQHPAIHVDDDGLQFITPRQEPLENPLNRLLKRLLDIVIALIVVVLILPPVCLVVWIFQRLQSKGPLFYRQTRAGIQNIPFSIIKFRTMRPDHEAEARQATPDDDRVYPFGRFLRRYSLDELPQFLNVLLGDMSIVGPRPHLVEHNDQFAKLLQNYHIRTFVRPGITGLAQVRGLRGEATTSDAVAHRLEADTLYLENWSLPLELGIIGRTAWQIIRPPKTAY